MALQPGWGTRKWKFATTVFTDSDGLNVMLDFQFQIDLGALEDGYIEACKVARERGYRTEDAHSQRISGARRIIIFPTKKES